MLKMKTWILETFFELYIMCMLQRASRWYENNISIKFFIPRIWVGYGCLFTLIYLKIWELIQFVFPLKPISFSTGMSQIVPSSSL